MTVLVCECLSSDNITFLDKAESADQVIAELSKQLSEALSADPAAVERAVRAREKARTTAFSNGAAIPHCRMKGLKRFGIALLVLRQPIRWDTEGHAVDTILMIAGPDNDVSAHLRILANSSQLLDSPTLRTKIKNAPDAAAAYELLSAAEQVVEKRRAEHGMLRELHKDHGNGNGDYLQEVVEQFQW